jgi:transcription elongation factor GreA
MADAQLSLEITLTAEGRALLRGELEELVAVARPAMADALRAAYESGEDSSSPQVVAARREQERLEARIARLDHALRHARVGCSGDLAEGVACVGSTVAVRRAGRDRVDRYTLVGPAEGDARRARISADSPLGRALLGRRAGEVVTVELPGGGVEVRVDEVRTAA